MSKRTKQQVAKPTGAPSTYSQEIADKICNLLSDGMSLRRICRDSDMPDKATVFRWLAAHESFRDQYARAREAQADAIFDEALDIADDSSNDYMLSEDGPTLNMENIQRSRLRIDTRKWMAGKLRPKVYGDKLGLTDGDGGPIAFVIRDMTKEDGK